MSIPVQELFLKSHYFLCYIYMYKEVLLCIITVFQKLLVDKYLKRRLLKDEIVKTFLNNDLALNYIKKKIKEIKNQVEDLDDYCVEETEDSYERYLNGRSMEDSVAIWLEEDEFYDELELLEEKSIQQEEEKDYEM